MSHGEAEKSGLSRAMRQDEPRPGGQCPGHTQLHDRGVSLLGSGLSSRMRDAVLTYSLQSRQS